MKIGFSLSRCVKDIHEERVHVDDVTVIISNSNIDPDNNKHWNQIWEAYTRYNGTWSEFKKSDEDKVRNIVKYLQNYGLLHQPRSLVSQEVASEQMLGYRRSGYHWMECVMVPEELDKNPSVKDAWERYQVIAALTK